MQVSPLPYHRAVADIVARENPASFAVLSRSARGSANALDQALLRTTYRLEAAAHPQVHAAVARAAAALELAGAGRGVRRPGPRGDQRRAGLRG